MISKIRSLSRGDFVRKAGVSVLCTMAAQAISLSGTIYMIRVFPQDQIGIYSVFGSYVNLVGIVSTLNYESSIPSLEEDSSAYHMAIWVHTLNLASTGLAMLIGFLLHYSLFAAVGLSLFFGGLGRLSEQFFVRRQIYRPLYLGRIIQAISFAGLILGWADGSAQSMAAAQFLSAGILAGFYGISLLLTKRGPSVRLSLSRVKALAVEKKKFALLYSPSQILNSATYNLPTILLERYFGPNVAAQYSVSVRILFTWINLVSTAVSQVYQGKMAAAYRQRSPHTLVMFQRLSKGLFWLGVATGVGALLLSPTVVSLGLGSRWLVAAHIAQALAPMYTAMMWVAPLGATFVVYETHEFLLANQFGHFVNSMVSFGYAILFKQLLAGCLMFSCLSVIRYVIIHRKMESVVREGLNEKPADSADRD